MKMFFSALILLPLIGYAQDGLVKMKVGKGSFELTKPNNRKYRFWDKEYGFQSLIRSNKTDYFNVCSFDTAMSSSPDTQVPIGDTKAEIFDVNFLQTSNKYLWFYGEWDKGENQDVIYAKEYDFKRQEFFDKPVFVLRNKRLFEECQFPGKPYYEFSDKFENKYAMYSSNDKTKNLIIYQYFPDRSRPKEWMGDFGFHVLDGNGQKLWSLDFQMPFYNDLTRIKSVSISNSGDVIIIVKVYNEVFKEFTTRGNPNYTFHLLRFQRGKSTPEIEPIGLGDRFIDQIDIEEKEANVFYCRGYYSDNKKSEKIDGMYFFSIDINTYGKIGVRKKIYSFKDYFNGVLSNETKGLRPEELYNTYSVDFLNFKFCVNLPDGGYYFIGEIGYYSADQGSPTSLNEYTNCNFYSDIYVAKFDADHSLLWILNIPKDQRYYRMYSVLSFNYLKDKSDLHFFYFDNPKNLNGDNGKPPIEYLGDTGGALFHAKLNGNGELATELLEDYKGEDTRLDVKTLLRVNNNRALIGTVYTPKKRNRAFKIWVE